MLVNKNPSRNDGCTPLHLVAENGQLKVCELILNNIQDKMPETLSGITPAMLASDNGHSEVTHLIDFHLKTGK